MFHEKKNQKKCTDMHMLYIDAKQKRRKLKTFFFRTLKLILKKLFFPPYQQV